MRQRWSTIGVVEEGVDNSFGLDGEVEGTRGLGFEFPFAVSVSFYVLVFGISFDWLECFWKVKQQSLSTESCVVIDICGLSHHYSHCDTFIHFVFVDHC
jgi:hypothetical protein